MYPGLCCIRLCTFCSSICFIGNISKRIYVHFSKLKSANCKIPFPNPPVFVDDFWVGILLDCVCIWSALYLFNRYLDCPPLLHYKCAVINTFLYLHVCMLAFLSDATALDSRCTVKNWSVSQKCPPHREPSCEHWVRDPLLLNSSEVLCDNLRQNQVVHSFNMCVFIY